MEIHALLGENGAGKSTLVKIIYGYYSADSGSIKWNGEEVKISSPAQAREMGIEMVFQHFSLFDAMTVRENIELVVPKTQSRSFVGSNSNTLQRIWTWPGPGSTCVHAFCWRTPAGRNSQMSDSIAQIADYG